ncbi:MAG: hypothetical protein EAX96_15895 [Candidatus Lokiarchaeota archaeon]|nr:hypothetical protein [Candidatus Lokiarchaeota archaeon]
MTFKYISPKELKILEKERMNYMKQAEKALKAADVEQVVELFKKIVEVSEKMDDKLIIEEFTQKIKLLTSGSETNVAEQFEKAQTTIEDFISELFKAPYRIIKNVTDKISIDDEEEEIVVTEPVKSKPFISVKGPERINDYDVTVIETEIKSRGTIQDQLGDLKKILKEKKESEEPNPEY